MSERVKHWLPFITLTLGIFGMLGFVQSWAVYPYRLEQTERAVRTLQDDRRVDREILIRIEERIKQLQERIGK
jgi:hypothetical protein